MADLAIQKAKAIAARLATITASDNLKRKFDGDFGGRKKKKVYVPVEQHPDINFIGLLIGPRGSTQKRLEEISGAKILLRGKGASKDPNEVDDHDDLHVLIAADTDEQIARAQKEIEEILFNPEKAMAIKREQLRAVAENSGGLGRSDSNYGPSTVNEVDTGVEVPRGLVGFIIGRGGETIRDIQLKSGAHIQIDREIEGASFTPNRIISVGGSKENVEHAKKLIHEMLDERKQSARHYGPGEIIHLDVPTERIGLIIGRGGSTIRSIQERTGASIQIPNEAESERPDIRKVGIVGNAEAREKAKIEVLKVLNNDNGTTTPSPGLAVEVPNDKIGMIIGRGGENIRGLQERTGCRIQIPHDDVGNAAPNRTITLSGTPEAIQRCKYEIDAIVSQPHLNKDNYNAQNSASSHGQSNNHYGNQSAQATKYYEQFAGYDASQYAAYTQQQQYAATATTTATTATTDPNDPNAYWNGYYAYAAYYGTEAANTAWGVTTATDAPVTDAPAP